MDAGEVDIELRPPTRAGAEGPPGRYTTGPFDLTYVEPGGVVRVLDRPPWAAESKLVIEVVGGAFRGRKGIQGNWYVPSELGPVHIRGVNR